MSFESWMATAGISIHALREEGDSGRVALCRQVHISIHALREEGDLERAEFFEVLNQFLSTPSARRATRALPFPKLPVVISIHALREEGDIRRDGEKEGQHISIHALREEGDSSCPSWAPTRTNFYPRPPRGGRLGGRGVLQQRDPISIHALREEGDIETKRERRKRGISIHALREEGDMTTTTSLPIARHFYPRPPRGGRRGEALLVQLFMNFYPRPPRGGRQKAFGPVLKKIEFLSTPSARRATEFGEMFSAGIAFLSTPSARRATQLEGPGAEPHPISIHALREEGDRFTAVKTAFSNDFYPRPPRGGRRGDSKPILRASKISIHALREEGDQYAMYKSECFSDISIHALREEGDWATRRR